MVFTAPGIPMLFQGQEFLAGEWFRDTVPVDWAQRVEFHGSVRLYHDLIRLRLNRDGVTRGLCGQFTQGYHVHDARKALAYHRDIARAVIQGEPEGFAKIIAERSSGQILGAAIVGAQACELIGEIAVAMAGRVSAWHVGDTQQPYPTLSELVRWTADQVGKASRSAAEQAPGVPVAV